MEKSTHKSVPVPEESQEETQAIVSRRRLLKALVVSSGAVAGLTMLPGKWTRPVVEAGELAAHAEASRTLFLDDVSFDCDWFIFIPYNCGGSACYRDVLGQVTESEDVELKFRIDRCESDTSAARGWEWDPHLEIEAINGDKNKGCIDYKLRLFSKQGAEPASGFCIEACIWLEVNGRKSNEVCWVWEH